MVLNEKFVDFKPELNEKGQEALPNLRDLTGSVFLIQSYEAGESKGRENKVYAWANIKTNVGVYHTASQRIVRQLKVMDETLKIGKEVRVKLQAEGISLRFVAP